MKIDTQILVATRTAGESRNHGTARQDAPSDFSMGFGTPGGGEGELPGILNLGFNIAGPVVFPSTPSIASKTVVAQARPASRAAASVASPALPPAAKFNATKKAGISLNGIRPKAKGQKGACVDVVAATDANGIAICPAIPECTSGGEPLDGSPSVEPESGADVQQVDEAVPTRYLVTKAGVFLAPSLTSSHLAPVKLSCYVRATAMARTATGDDWSLVVEFTDLDGQARTLRVPMDMLATAPGRLVRLLQSKGAWISSDPDHHHLFAHYLTTSAPTARALLVAQPGWTGPVYVMPNGKAYGPVSEKVILDGSSGGTAEGFRERGELEAWQIQVAARCANNSRLMLALSAAFAGPMLHLLGEDSAGVHFCGSSSIGKTTTLHVACSVWGEPKRLTKTWRATVNGLEGIAVERNDGLLALDEIGEADPSALSKAIYMIANGGGKARADIHGAAKRSSQWRLVVVSSGETTVGGHLSAGGLASRAGQQVRLVDVPADAGAGLGVFEDLHDVLTGGELAQRLKQGCAELHGSAGRAFLDYVALPAHKDLVTGAAASTIDQFAAMVAVPGQSSQVQRVSRTFGLIAAAGELAIAAGVLPWAKGQAIWAAEVCFEAWSQLHGEEISQEATALTQAQAAELVRQFFEVHGETGFAPLPLTGAESSSDSLGAAPMGYRRMGQSGQIEFLVRPSAFRGTLCQGFDPRQVAQHLITAGVLMPDSAGKASRAERVPPENKPCRMYVMTPSVMEAGQDGNSAAS